jgi:hypothetical protein
MFKIARNKKTNNFYSYNWLEVGCGIRKGMDDV